MYLPKKIENIKISNKEIIIGSSIVSVTVLSIFIARRFLGIKSRIVRNAEKYLHVREIRTDGKNNYEFSDKKFEKKMKDVGWKHGYAWCASFVEVVILDTFTGEKREILKKLMNPGTQDTYKNFKKNKDKYNWYNISKIPKKGAIAVWQNQENKSLGHFAIVTSVDFYGFKTIEGNHYTHGKEGVRRGTHTFAEYNKIKGNKLIGFINFK